MLLIKGGRVYGMAPGVSGVSEGGGKVAGIHEDGRAVGAHANGGMGADVLLADGRATDVRADGSVVADVLVADGKVAAISRNISETGDMTIISATGLVVAPGSLTCMCIFAILALSIKRIYCPDQRLPQRAE